jgi:hypothetical protein
MYSIERRYGQLCDLEATNRSEKPSGVMVIVV